MFVRLRLCRTPNCVIPRAGWFELAQWGGPRVSSIQATSIAALVRASRLHLVPWREMPPALAAVADEPLPIAQRVIHHSLSPTFWLLPSFCEFLAAADA
eukprot:8899799-Pyramimonas_sp.AAC.1